MEFMRESFIVLVLVLNLIFHATGIASHEGLLYLDYYKESCPLAEEIVRRQVQIAVMREPRMAASLLRLHFHDCFVLGCDASVLLDNSLEGGIVSEKLAGPNINSIRGFEVIDKIKYILEDACPCTVSCADILAIAARDSVTLRGGPSWEVWLGRRDSREASFSGANLFIPLPNSSLETLISNFKQQGLDTYDLVALSGGHTFGKARCTSFRQRVYSDEISYEYISDHNNYEITYKDRYKRNTMFRRMLRSICPESGRDDDLAPLDFVTPSKFDNFYFQNIIQGKGLLQSDNVLVTDYDEDHEGYGWEVRKQVWAYAHDQELFFASFANSIVKMGNINVLTGDQGEIRKNCRFVNI